MSESIRLDKWLWAARFFKTRVLATEAVSGGKVHLNDNRVKPGREVKVGDRLTIQRGGYAFEIVVLAINKQRRPAKEAQLLFEESEDSIKAREEQAENQRLANSGQHFSDPLIVNDHQVVTSHRFEALGVNKKGDIYLAWLDKRDLLAAKKAGQPYNGAALYYAISTDGGITFNTNEKIIDNTCQCCRVAMAIDTDQLPVVLWRHIFGDNIRDHALVKFDSRMKAGKVVQVSHDQWQVEACPHHGPDISIAEDGVYHLAWFNNAAERHGLFYANSHDQGKSFSEAVSFGDYKAQAAHPQVLSLGKTVFLAWKEFDGKQATLMMMKSSDSGKTWSAPRILEKTTGNSDHPLLIANGNEVYAVWHRRGQGYQLFPLEND